MTEDYEEDFSETYGVEVEQYRSCIVLVNANNLAEAFEKGRQLAAIYPEGAATNYGEWESSLPSPTGVVLTPKQVHKLHEKEQDAKG